MIDMFREMRRKDRSIDKRQAVQLLEAGQYGVLSTVGENGYTYGVPLNYVYHKGNIYFHCAVEGNKMDNLTFNNRVSFCVIGNTEPIPDKFSYRYESVIVFGRAREVHDGEKEDALIALIRKYSSGFMEKGMEYIKKDCHNVKVIKICIEHLTGKARK
jgi:nitroimidazol reductase NimA-like FMN-containing flavoprotein (pyridoxamine 5'-phosphate oxidase superfamily)